MRPSLIVSAVLLAGGLAATPEAQQTKPTFDVVSIKPRAFRDEGDLRAFASGMGMCGGYRFTATVNRVNLPGTNICSLLRMAFDLTEYQIVAPAWTKEVSPNVFFDIVVLGKEGAQLSVDDARVMMQSMLADRFKLTYHREQRAAPVYALVVAPQGHKLRTQEIDPCPRTMGPLAVWAVKGTYLSCKPTTSMSQLVFILGREVDRPVVDRTGMNGSYAVSLNWAGNDPLSGNADAPSIFTAVKQYLGLNLEASTEPVEALVVDHIERPTSN